VPDGPTDKSARGSEEKPLMRSLGEFFGHIARAIKTDPAKAEPGGPGGAAPAKGERRVVSERVEEREVPSADGTGRMVLRRTVIEEVEIEGRSAAGDADRRDSPRGRGGPSGGEGGSGVGSG